MNLHELQKISELQHFKDVAPERLITDFGLYDSLILDTAAIRCCDQFIGDEEPHVESGLDIEALHNFAYLSTPLMLPCPYCGRMQAFKPDSGYRNPKNKPLNGTGSLGKRSKGLRRISMFESNTTAYSPKEYAEDPEYLYKEEQQYADLSKRIAYNFSEDRISTNPHNVFDRGFDFNRVKDSIARKVMGEITRAADDLRKDFVCSYDESHHLFVEFALYPAADSLPDELLAYEERLSQRPDTRMTDDESAAKRLYEELRYCLIARKIAQYPSMADMQFFDKVRYKPVLKRQYTNYTMALGLYASGVGVGAFVYLRRIMESIVEEFHQQCTGIDGWNEGEYAKRRFNEKIEYIEGFGGNVIPEELGGVKTRLYGVLSKGVHSASEDECKSLFPYMKFAIETFFDKKVEDMERQKKIEALSREVENVSDS